MDITDQLQKSVSAHIHLAYSIIIRKGPVLEHERSFGQKKSLATKHVAARLMAVTN